MQALLHREGYIPTRYQGAQAVFNAQTKTLTLKGKPAGVNREQTILVGDSIIYSDSTKIIVARGDTVILRDPEQQAADVIARGEMSYNVELHRDLLTIRGRAAHGNDHFRLATFTFFSDNHALRAGFLTHHCRQLA